MGQVQEKKYIRNEDQQRKEEKQTFAGVLMRGGDEETRLSAETVEDVAGEEDMPIAGILTKI